MKKFNAIEGLRGWLAWAVVLAHLVQTSDVTAKGLGPALSNAGHAAVLIFMIVSGFVITHLVVEKREPYGAYLTRRFMRIFPLFAVTCGIGFFTADIHASVLSRVPWATEPHFSDTLQSLTEIARSNHENFWRHLLAHATMLHGAISNDLLPHSQYAFNAPAWSISLEWQFYLLAPLAVLIIMRSPPAALFLATISAALGFLYAAGLFGSFRNPSLLPAATGYFAIGIASRLFYPWVEGTIRHPSAVFALLIALLPLGWEVAPVLIWCAVMTGILVHPSAEQTAPLQCYRRALQSQAAVFFGARSYSVYLCHLPVIAITHSIWLHFFPMASRASTFIGLTCITPLLILPLAELLYRGVEKPGISFGARIAKRVNRRLLAAREVMPQAPAAP